MKAPNLVGTQTGVSRTSLSSGRAAGTANKSCWCPGNRSPQKLRTWARSRRPVRPNVLRQAGGATEGLPDNQWDQPARAEGDGAVAMVFDAGEGSDILDAIVAEGRW